MVYLTIALLILCVIVVTSLKVHSLVGKVGIFLAIFALTFGFLWSHSPETFEVARHVFIVDYPQFIFIPLVAIAIAGLNLFQLNVPPATKLGWLFLLVFPLAGNFATTWAVVPLAISIYPILKKRNPDRWLLVLLTVSIFSMNTLALMTTAADPPQSLLAVKEGQKGQNLDYFFPLTYFWPYLLGTWLMFAYALTRLGEQYGNPWKELKSIRPASWAKLIYGGFIALAIWFAITQLREYQITIFLASVFGVVLISSFFFGGNEREHTMHWSLETVTIFLAFFSVVAFAHLGLHQVHISPNHLYIAVIGMTLGADNAAAFAAAYPVYESLGMEKQVWYNLFPSVVFGGLSPLGNGPQIITFLVVLPMLKAVTTKEVFRGWLTEAWVFAPYLVFWQLATTTLIEYGFSLKWNLLCLIAIPAVFICFESMDITKKFSQTLYGKNNGGNNGEIKDLTKSVEAA